MTPQETEKQIEMLKLELKKKDEYIDHLEKLSEAYTNLSELYNQELLDADRTLKAHEIIQNMMTQERRKAEELIKVHENLQLLSDEEKKHAEETIKAHEKIQELNDMEKREKDILLRAQQNISNLSEQELIEKDSIIKEVMEIYKKINAILDLNELLKSILNTVVKTTGAQRGVLFLNEENNMAPKIFSAIKLEDIQDKNFKNSLEIINSVVKDRKSSLIQEHGEGKFAVICAPLLFEEHLLGVLYVDARSSQIVFRQNDLYSTEIFCSEAAISIHNSMQYEAMKTKNGELLRLVNMKNMFVSLLSDDINKPLKSIQDNLLKVSLLDKGEPQKQYLKNTLSLVEKIQNTLTKVLQMGMLEKSVDELFSETFDFRTLIDRVLKNQTQGIKEKNIKFHIDLSRGFEEFHGNSLLLRVVLDELISNSIFYNKENGLVAIRGRENDQHLTLEIEDTGHGIKEENLEKIFGQFYRTEESSNLNSMGAGLGLFMARNIAKYYGGDISVKSKYGKGSVFIVTLLNH
jgi:signal transduction histidine kinase